MFYAFKQYQEKHILPNPLQISYEKVMIGGTNFEYTAFLNFKNDIIEPVMSRPTYNTESFCY